MQQVSPLMDTIVRAAARKFAKSWKSPIDGVDDLAQIGLMAALKAHETYRFGQSTYTTWITRAANCEMIDRQRHLERRRKWEDGYQAEQRPEVDLMPDDSPLSLPEQLVAIYTHALRTPMIRTQRHDGWRRQRARRVAVAFLFSRRKMSVRGAVHIFGSDKRLCDAIGVDRPPCKTFFAKCAKSRTLFGVN